MQEFSCFYGGRNLQALNIYWQYKNAIHLSCVILCDSHTINKECLSPGKGISKYHKFPLQLPSQSNHVLWITAIKWISSNFLTLPTSLGDFICCPHKPFRWTNTEDGSIVHLIHSACQSLPHIHIHLQD